MKREREEDYYNVFKNGWVVKVVESEVFEHNNDTKTASVLLAIIEKL